MNLRIAILLAFCSTTFAARKPVVGDGQTSNSVASLDATVYADPESVKQQVGSDLQSHYIVIKVQIAPKNGKLPVSLDDFTLRTDKDGEKSHPFVASQIAGQGALVISDTDGGGGGAKGQPNRPSWGMGGLGMGGGGVGNAAHVQGTKATMDQGKEKPLDPLMESLTTKMLVEKETEQPVTGFLYFPMEKQKLKDLELIYTTSAGKLSIRFR